MAPLVALVFAGEAVEDDKVDDVSKSARSALGSRKFGALSANINDGGQLKWANRSAASR